MSREVGFYLVVCGSGIYLALVCLIFGFPVMAALTSQLVSDEAIFYLFLCLVFYPIAMFLILLGNRVLRVFLSKWLIPLSLIPFWLAAFLCIS